jgi:hypothetical protein
MLKLFIVNSITQNLVLMSADEYIDDIDLKVFTKKELKLK